MATVLYDGARHQITVALAKKALVAIGVADDNGDVMLFNGQPPASVNVVAAALVKYLQDPPLAVGDIVPAERLLETQFATVVRMRSRTQNELHVRTGNGWLPALSKVAGTEYIVEFIPPEVAS